MMTSLKIADLQQDAYTEGREEGISLGMVRGREEGISLGMERGREEGVYQNKLETAKAMIVIGLPEEQIQLCTGLPLETVQELVKK